MSLPFPWVLVLRVLLLRFGYGLKVSPKPVSGTLVLRVTMLERQNLSEVDLRFLGRDRVPWKELQHPSLSTLGWFTLTRDPTVGFWEAMELRKA